MPSACLRKSASSASNCSDVIDWLPAPHMFLSVNASRTVNLSLGLRPVNSPVSAHRAASADRPASPAASECSQSCGAPKFQFTPLSFFKPNLSAPKAPLCTPVSCNSNPPSAPNWLHKSPALSRKASFPYPRPSKYDAKVNGLGVAGAAITAGPNVAPAEVQHLQQPLTSNGPV